MHCNQQVCNSVHRWHRYEPTKRTKLTTPQMPSARLAHPACVKRNSSPRHVRKLMKKTIRSRLARRQRNTTETTVSHARYLVCSLPRDKWEAAEKAMTDNATLQGIARELGVSKASVFRHARNHLMPRVNSSRVPLLQADQVYLKRLRC